MEKLQKKKQKVTHTVESVYGRISEDCRGDQSENKKVSTAPNVPKLRSRGWSLKGSGEKFRLIASFTTVAKPQTRHHVVRLSVSSTHLIKIRTIHWNKRRRKKQPTVTALCEWDYVNAASFQQIIFFSFFSFFFSALSSARLTQTVLADGGRSRQVLPWLAANHLSSLCRPVASCPQLSTAGWEHNGREESLGTPKVRVMSSAWLQAGGKKILLNVNLYP